MYSTCASLTVIIGVLMVILPCRHFDEPGRPLDHEGHGKGNGHYTFPNLFVPVIPWEGCPVKGQTTRGLILSVILHTGRTPSKPSRSGVDVPSLLAVTQRVR